STTGSSSRSRPTHAQHRYYRRLTRKLAFRAATSPRRGSSKGRHMRSKLLLLALACLAFAAVATAQGAPPQTPPAPPSSTDTADSSEVSATGTWEGAIEIPGSPLGVVVTLAGEAGSLSGTIDIPAQGAAGLALTAVSVEGQAVTFAIANTPGSPTFDGTLDGDAITGTFTQSG